MPCLSQRQHLPMCAWRGRLEVALEVFGFFSPVGRSGEIGR